MREGGAHLGVGGGEHHEQGDRHEGEDAGRQSRLGALGLLLGGDGVAGAQRGRGSFEGCRRRPAEAGTRAQHGERQTGGTRRVDVGGIEGDRRATRRGGLRGPPGAISADHRRLGRRARGDDRSGQRAAAAQRPGDRARTSRRPRRPPVRTSGGAVRSDRRDRRHSPATSTRPPASRPAIGAASTTTVSGGRHGGADRCRRSSPSRTAIDRAGPTRSSPTTSRSRRRQRHLGRSPRRSRRPGAPHRQFARRGRRRRCSARGGRGPPAAATPERPGRRASRGDAGRRGRCWHDTSTTIRRDRCSAPGRARAPRGREPHRRRDGPAADARPCAGAVRRRSPPAPSLLAGRASRRTT